MKRTLLALLLALSVSGCETLTPRQNLENACIFAFLAGIPIVGPIAGPWLCTFGIDLALPAEDEDEEEDDE